MTKMKAPLADPAAPLRHKLDEARTLAARLEAENAAAVQAEEHALEAGSTSAIVAARSRALGVADALARHRVKVADLEAQLAAVEADEAARAAKERLVKCTVTASGHALDDAIALLRWSAENTRNPLTGD
ncbi:MAG: hypothetical protein ACREOQ_17675 [Gemmatimonadales bacterium]